jgi:hypothetical protein
MTLAAWAKPVDVAAWAARGAGCEQLFGPLTLARLGDQPSCDVPYGRKLSVLLGPGATLGPGPAQIRYSIPRPLATRGRQPVITKHLIIRLLIECRTLWILSLRS